MRQIVLFVGRHMLGFGTTKGRLRFIVIWDLCVLKWEVEVAGTDKAHLGKRITTRILIGIEVDIRLSEADGLLSGFDYMDEMQGSSEAFESSISRWIRFLSTSVSFKRTIMINMIAPCRGIQREKPGFVSRWSVCFCVKAPTTWICDGKNQLLSDTHFSPTNPENIKKELINNFWLYSTLYLEPFPLLLSATNYLPTQIAPSRPTALLNLLIDNAFTRS